MKASEIKWLRYGLGLTQTEFAHKLGVGYTTLNRWENGKHKPTKLALEKLNQLKKEYDENQSSGSE